MSGRGHHHEKALSFCQVTQGKLLWWDSGLKYQYTLEGWFKFQCVTSGGLLHLSEELSRWEERTKGRKRTDQTGSERIIQSFGIIVYNAERTESVSQGI